MNNTDKLKPIMRCGAGCGTAHDCAFPDCVDIEATLETLKVRESEIAELTKQRDELYHYLDQMTDMFEVEMGIDNYAQCIAALERVKPLSTQEANK